MQDSTDIPDFSGVLHDLKNDVQKCSTEPCKKHKKILLMQFFLRSRWKLFKKELHQNSFRWNLWNFAEQLSRTTFKFFFWEPYQNSKYLIHQTKAPFYK